MSVLSKYQYNKLCNILDSIRVQLEDTTFDAQSRAQLDYAKIELIYDKLKGQNQKNIQQGAENLLKVNTKYQQARKKFKKRSEKLDLKIREVEEDYKEHVYDLEKMMGKSKEWRKKQMGILEKKMENAISELQVQSNLLHERELDSLSEEKKYFMAEIQKCEKDIQVQRDHFREDQINIESKANAIEIKLLQKVQVLKQKQRNKKMGFLELLENVIIKIKEAEALES